MPHLPRRGTAPPDRQAWDALTTKTVAQLLAMGLSVWNSQSRLMLFPVDWYDVIPLGLEVETLSGVRAPFDRAVHDNDHRWGALAFGVRAKEG